MNTKQVEVTASVFDSFDVMWSDKYFAPSFHLNLITCYVNVNDMLFVHG